MTEIEYKEALGVRHSELLKIKSCPAKYKWEVEHPAPPTDSLIFGQVVHKLLLQPEDFENEFCVAPLVDRRTKDGRAAYEQFIAENVGKTVVKPEMVVVANEMVTALKQMPYIDKLLSGEKEQPIFWVDDLTGEPCKARADCISQIGSKTVIVDYKTTTDASPEAFMRSAINNGYDFQAAMYLEGYKKSKGEEAKFVFIVQEKEAPYAVNIFEADEMLIKRGNDIFRELIGIYHDCKVTDNWYGYLGKYEVINNLGLPAWLAKDVE